MDYREEITSLEHACSKLVVSLMNIVQQNGWRICDRDIRIVRMASRARNDPQTTKLGTDIIIIREITVNTIMESDKLYRVQKEDLPKVEKMLNQCFARSVVRDADSDPEVRKNLMPELFKCDMDEFYATQ